MLVEVDDSTENPLVVADGTPLHHGGFVTARLSATLDALRQATYPVISLSAARLSALINPSLSGLPAFLASGPAGSSGVMILEYLAQDALARARILTTPVSTGHASVSLGLEEHASFSTQAVWASEQMVDLRPVVLGCELVAAVRALRMDPVAAARQPRPRRCTTSRRPCSTRTGPTGLSATTSPPPYVSSSRASSRPGSFGTVPHETQRPPVILVVATPGRSARIEAELANRYARDYDLRVTEDPDAALALVPALAEQGSQVALLAVDHDVEGGALDLMDALRALTPASRRIVLIDVGTFRTALESLRPALAQGRLDTFLLIPQGPRDEEFHTAISEYLSDWGWSSAPPEVVSVRIVDDGAQPEVTGIRDFLDRMGLSYARHRPDTRRGPRHPQRGRRRHACRWCSRSGGSRSSPPPSRPWRPRSTARPPTSARTTSPTCSSWAPVRPASPLPCTARPRGCARSCWTRTPWAGRPAPAR